MIDEAELVYRDAFKGLRSEASSFSYLPVDISQLTLIILRDSLYMLSDLLCVVSFLLSVVICLSCFTSDLPFFCVAYSS